jgi:hypothetical protein
VVGVVLVVLAVFVRESERTSLRDGLAAWWVRVDDVRARATSVHVRFLRASFGVWLAALDWALGPAHFSIRGLWVGLCTTLASLCLTLVAIFWTMLLLAGLNVPAAVQLVAEHDVHWWMALPTVAWALGFLACACVPAAVRPLVVRLPGIPARWRLSTPEFWPLIALIAAAGTVPLWFGLVSLLQGFYQAGHPRMAIGAAVALLVGAGWDLIFFAIVRTALRWSSRLERGWHFIVLCGALLVGALLLVYGPLEIAGLLMRRQMRRSAAVAGVTGVTNLADLMIAGLGLFAMLLLALHRAFWPVLERPIYVLQEYIPNRKILLALGVTLILVRWPWIATTASQGLLGLLK